MAVTPSRIAVVGRGRAGRSLASALGRVGFVVECFGHKAPAVPGLSETLGPDGLVLLCVPDAHIARVAQSIRPGPAVVAHVAGSHTLTVLSPHERRASLHPLMSLTDPESGAARLLDGCVFAVAGEGHSALAAVQAVADQLGGRSVELAEDRRAVYHAAAAVASNHLVALCAQVVCLADAAGLPRDTFDALMRASLENAQATSAVEALTGPASRADWSTIARHLDVIPSPEIPAYAAMSERAATLAGHAWPTSLDRRPSDRADQASGANRAPDPDAGTDTGTDTDTAPDPEECSP